MATDPHDFQQFLQQRADIALAYVNGDAAPLDAIATRREPAVFFPPGGGHVDGVAAVSRNYHEGAGHFGAGSDSQVEVLQSQDSGDLAYWAGIQRARVRVKGKPEPVSMDLRVTEVLRREDGAWRLVHRHADMLAEPRAKQDG